MEVHKFLARRLVKQHNISSRENELARQRNRFHVASGWFAVEQNAPEPSHSLQAAAIFTALQSIMHSVKVALG